MNGINAGVGNTAAGAIVQIVAKGAMNKYLDEGAQSTFWKCKYDKTTSFAMESVIQPFNSQVQLGQTAQITLNRTGDLVYFMYVLIEEYYVPALELITSKEMLNIPKPLIGCTIMAAGNCLPELSMSLIALLVTGSQDVGTGEVFGSCVFDLLGILGVAAPCICWLCCLIIVVDAVEGGHLPGDLPKGSNQADAPAPRLRRWGAACTTSLSTAGSTDAADAC